MKAILDTKTIIGLLIPPFLIIMDLLVVPSTVPSVTPTRMAEWVTGFKKAKETALQLRTAVPEIPSLQDPFHLVQERKTPPKKTYPSVQVKKGEEIKWTLSMVILGPKKRLALLNGIEVYEGSIINGYLVKEISKDYVLLTRGKETKKIYLQKEG